MEGKNYLTIDISTPLQKKLKKAEKDYKNANDQHNSIFQRKKALECSKLYELMAKNDPVLRNRYKEKSRQWKRRALTIEKGNLSKNHQVFNKEKNIKYGLFPCELLNKYDQPIFIGQGGFAYVFKAVRCSNGEYVAVKVPLNISEQTGKTFIKEIKNWTDLNHRNIVDVLDYNILPTPYFEMELCDFSLESVPKPMDTLVTIWTLLNILDGLYYAHQKGIIHKDLKPGNILIKDNIPKISDWGLSKVIAKSKLSSINAFSPLYAAPEQVSPRFGTRDERTDIWQIGVLLYEMSTGILPFFGDDITEVIAKIVTQSCVPPSKHNKKIQFLDKIIINCLHKSKEDRYQSISALKEDLMQIINDEYADSSNNMQQKSIEVFNSVKSSTIYRID